MFSEILKVAHEQWPQTYGEMFRVYVTASPGVMLLAPELIEVTNASMSIFVTCNQVCVQLIINDPNVLDKSKEYGFLHPWLGLGLLTSSGRADDSTAVNTRAICRRKVETVKHFWFWFKVRNGNLAGDC